MEGTTIHGTCVAYGDVGILLRGPSGSGKSDLALRLIEDGALLVADDRIVLTQDADGTLLAAAPPSLSGLLELRGIGLVEVPHAASVRVVLVVELGADSAPERLPRPVWCEYLDCRIRLMTAKPFEPSAPAKVRIAAFAAAGQSDPATGATVRRRDED